MQSNFREWMIAPDSEGNFPDAQITHAILQDIRGLLKSIRAMAQFFVVLTVIGLIVEFLYAITH